MSAAELAKGRADASGVADVFARFAGGGAAIGRADEGCHGSRRTFSWCEVSRCNVWYGAALRRGAAVAGRKASGAPSLPALLHRVSRGAKPRSEHALLDDPTKSDPRRNVRAALLQLREGNQPRRAFPDVALRSKCEITVFGRETRGRRRRADCRSNVA